jgi:hypothetical protein
MKRIAAVLLALCAGTAHATVLAYTENQAGGLIQFTDNPCSISGYEADITDAAGNLREQGCWMWSEPNVVVSWSTGSVMYYNGANVILTDAAKARIKRKPTL